ncbi:hypothetical protein LTS08_004262 [Lithohypha guttulata]|nr:hypothetical protein LTS08_004262 [Lithohypha guttulata]
MVDVDSPHVSSVTSDFKDQAVKTETQAERMAQEADHKARVESARAEEKVKEEANKAKEKAEEAKNKAAAKGKEVKKAAKQEARHLDANKDNPVFVGNAILWTVTAVAVAVGAYQKHTEGKLDVELAGKVALGLGVLGAADYFGSKWLVENKFPVDNSNK